MTPADQIIAATVALSRALRPLILTPPAPAAAAGDPTDYAISHYAAYLRIAASGPRRVLLVGMNSSMHGQAHTGVPFGDVSAARQILAGVDVRLPAAAGVRAPDGRLVLEARGLGYHRGEQSGGRLWSALEQIVHGSLHDVLARVCVINFCPLLFIGEDGANITPTKLKRGLAVELLDHHCDEHLRSVVAALRPAVVIGVGEYAHAACCRALVDVGVAAIMRIKHPSPLAGSARAWFAEAAPILATAMETT